MTAALPSPHSCPTSSPSRLSLPIGISVQVNALVSKVSDSIISAEHSRVLGAGEIGQSSKHTHASTCTQPLELPFWIKAIHTHTNAMSVSAGTLWEWHSADNTRNEQRAGAEKVSEGSNLLPSSSEVGAGREAWKHSLMNCEVVPDAPALTTLILPSAYGPLKG
jgi:hypothetical protein